jgi:hypothetical protein
MTQEDDILDKAQEEIAEINEEEQYLINEAAKIIGHVNPKRVDKDIYHKALQWMLRYGFWKQTAVMTSQIKELFEDDDIDVSYNVVMTSHDEEE